MSTIETSSLEQIKIKALNDAAAALQALAKAATRGKSVDEQVEALNSQLAALKEILAITADVEAYAAIFRQIIAQGGQYRDPQSNELKQFYLTIFVDKVTSMDDSVLTDIVDNIQEAHKLCQDLLDNDIAAFGGALQTLDSTVSTLELSSKPLGSVILNESEIAVLCSRVEEGAMPAAKKVVDELNEDKPDIRHYPIYLQSKKEKDLKISRPGIVLVRHISEISDENDTFFMWVFAENEEHDVKVQIDFEDIQKFRELQWPDTVDVLQSVESVEQTLFETIDNLYRMEKVYIEGSEHQDITTLNTAQKRLMCTLGCLGLPDEDSDCLRLAYDRHKKSKGAGENYLPSIYGLHRAIPETFYANGFDTYLVGKRLEQTGKIGRNLMDVNTSPEDQYQLAIQEGDIENFDRLVDGCSDKNSPDYYSFFNAAKMAIKSNQFEILKRVIEKEKIEARLLRRKPMNELESADDFRNLTLLINALLPENVNTQIVAYLVEEGADIFVHNKRKKNALKLAFEKNNPEAILNAILDGIERRFDAKNDEKAKKHIAALRRELNSGDINQGNVDTKFHVLMMNLTTKPVKNNSFRDFFPIRNRTASAPAAISRKKDEPLKRGSQSEGDLSRFTRDVAENAEETPPAADSKKIRRSVSLNDLMPSRKIAKTSAEKTPEEIRLELIKLIDERLKSLGDITAKSSPLKITKVNELHRLRAILKGEDAYLSVFLIQEENKKKIDCGYYSISGDEDSSLLPSAMKKAGDVVGRLNLASTLLNRPENREILARHRNERAHKTMTKIRETFIHAIENLLGRKMEEGWRESLSKTALFIETFNQLWSGPTVKPQPSAETKIVAKVPRTADNLHAVVTASRNVGVFRAAAKKIEEANPVLSKIAQSVQGIRLPGSTRR